MAVDENALEAAADAIVRMKLDHTAIYGPTEYARAAIAAMRHTHALPSHLDNLHNRATLGLRMDGELYGVSERAAPKLSEEERARVEEVRERHEADRKDTRFERYANQAHSDRAFLLSLIDKLSGVG